MKITILLKSEPCADEAGRALQTAADMLGQGHTVRLFLLQEAVRFCRPGRQCPNYTDFAELLGKNIEVHVLTRDAELRGIVAPFADQAVSDGSYESLVDLMVSCDQVVGIL